MQTTFFIISKEVEFSESAGKGARIEATVMELDKPSGNNKLYRMDEGETIAKSLKNKPVFYGATSKGKHANPIIGTGSNDPVGIVERAWVIGNKIKAIVKITAQSLIETLKRGVKYLFSVGGVALAETIKNIGNRAIHVLHGVTCNHLQIFNFGEAIAGFPNAKMEKLIEINETVMFFPRSRTIEIIGSGIKSVTLTRR